MWAFLFGSGVTSISCLLRSKLSDVHVPTQERPSGARVIMLSDGVSVTEDGDTGEMLIWLPSPVSDMDSPCEAVMILDPFVNEHERNSLSCTVPVMFVIPMDRYIVDVGLMRILEACNFRSGLDSVVRGIVNVFPDGRTLSFRITGCTHHYLCVDR